MAVFVVLPTRGPSLYSLLGLATVKVQRQTEYPSEGYTSMTLPVSADESSLGRFVPVSVNVRSRITQHGAPTKTAIY